MKKSLKMAVMFICVSAACLLLASPATDPTECSAESMTEDEILLSTGMPQEEIDALDHDMKAYIVNDLIESGEIYHDLTYIPSEEIQVPEPGAEDVLSGIKFAARAFKSNHVVTVYPMYEFTSDKKPAGGDCFAYYFGDAFRPYEYGGKLWYKDSTMTNWEVGGNLTANTQTFDGAAFSGVQLGSPDWSMKLKGCTYARAKTGSGIDKGIVMNYVYNPQGYNYSVSISSHIGGIALNCPGRLYKTAGIMFLEY